MSGTGRSKTPARKTLARKAGKASNSLTREEYLAQLDYEWSEKQLQEKVNRDFAGEGWLFYHTHYSKGSQDGFPDLVALREETGRQVVIELKVKDNKPTADQRAWMRAFRRSGSEVYLFYPRDFYTIVKLAEGGYRPEWEWTDPGEQAA